MGKKLKVLPQIRSKALVAVGSNRPFGEIDAASIVNAAAQKIAATAGVIRAQSGLFRTPAFPPGSGPDFVNAALVVETGLGADDLLGELHEIEDAFGRMRAARWGARTLDLDLIAFDGIVQPDLETYRHWHRLPIEQQQQQAPKTLILPHPRMHERAFVLVPLMDVAPDWVHPVIGKSVSEMLEALPDSVKEEVKRL